MPSPRTLFDRGFARGGDARLGDGPRGTWHVSSSGEVDRTTVTVPGAVNAQVPAELVAWHTKGPAHAEDSASTRTSIDCSAGACGHNPPDQRRRAAKLQVEAGA
jgi:hypothetical protein